MGGAGRNLIRLVAVGACLALPACSTKPAPGGAHGGRSDKARRDAEKLAAECATGAAASQARALPELEVHRTWKDRLSGRAVPPKGGTPPALPPVSELVLVKGPVPKAPPRPGVAPLVVRERVVSAIPFAKEAEAEESAVAVACEVVERKLADLDPPVQHKVSPNEVRNEFLRLDSRTTRGPSPEEEKVLGENNITGPHIYIEYDVEVTADQVRALRAQERVGAGLRFLGILTAVVLAGFLFLRADECTRGYLTSWLALGAVALAGGAVAALIFV